MPSSARRPRPARRSFSHAREPKPKRLLLDSATSRRLGQVRQKDTEIELAVRKVLYAMGVRFRVGNRDLPGSPDIANRSGQWAIFVHGCFWHAHRGCRRATVPKRNRAFWQAKFAANRARDARVVRELHRLGFRTLVIWECDAKRPERIERRLRAFVNPAGN